jgi:NADPH-ferrihemoprotein reductase
MPDDQQAPLAEADSALTSAGAVSAAAGRLPASAPAAPAEAPAHGSKQLLILYGTQTGNSRGVAKELCDAAAGHGFDARVVGMEKFKELEFDRGTPVLIVCSSTGTGDAPDNADKFFRLVKRRTTPPIFAEVPFAVCALGDSNYDQFCEIGRQFDQHLERLGGVRLLKRCDVDEVDGIEAHVGPWIGQLWPALRALPAAGAKANGVRNGAATDNGTAAAAAPPTALPAAAEPAAPPVRRLTVLHGGDLSSEIAEIVARAATSACAAAEIRLLPMSDFKPWITDVQAAPMNAPEHAVFIVQTAENELPPESAGGCTRYFGRRTHPPGLLAGRLAFSVLGLGDSNLLLDRQTTTAKDCNQVAQLLDARLEALGATRFHPHGEADDRTGNQEIKPWIASLRAALGAAGASGSLAVAPAASANGAPPALRDGGGAREEEEVGTSPSAPLLAPLVAARWLTTRTDPLTVGGRAGWLTGAAAASAASSRRVLHLELDVSRLPPSAQLQPGDAVAVLPSNDPTDVAELMSQLGVRARQADAPLPPESGDRPMHLDGELTPRLVFSDRVDIGSTSTWPSTLLLRLLLHHAEPANAHGPRVAQVRRVLSPPLDGSLADSRAAHAELLRERPPLLQLLRELASQPPLAKLIDALPPLAPRWYSIASSPLACPGRVHLCLSVATYLTRDATGEQHLRRGVASHWLARLGAPLLATGEGAPAGAPAAVRIPIYAREEPSGYELRLPSSPATPIVLIGPGTGLAPFRAFMQHRRFQHARKALGPCRLYFGCRARQTDYLYGDELETMSAAGALTLRTAFSRDGPAASAGCWRGVRVGIEYVQDLLELDARQVGETLFEQGGHVYVCGDGQWMAADVHAALRRVAEAHLALAPADAETKLQGLMRAGRYTREIWN